MTPRIYGPFEDIRRDYLLAELRQESAPLGVAGSVYIQCGWPPENAAGETRWVKSLADQSEGPLAIIGWANLADPGIGRLLDTHGESANFAAYGKCSTGTPMLNTAPLASIKRRWRAGRAGPDGG